jgi:hypothetical protein
VLTAAIAAPKISFDTVAVISFSADVLLSARRWVNYIAANSTTAFLNMMQSCIACEARPITANIVNRSF